METLARAITELRERNYGSAIRLLEMLTVRDPSNAEAFRHLSQAYYRTGEREKAAEAAQRYAALRPTDATGHHNLGVLLAQLGQAAAAERAFRAALSAEPGHAKARRALHRLAGEAGVVDRATAGVPQVQAPEAEAGDPRRRSVPWQAKLAAGLTVVASVAILLWLFLPGGPANPGPATQAPVRAPNPVALPPAQQPATLEPRVAGEPRPAPTPEPTAPPQMRPQLEPDTQDEVPQRDESQHTPAPLPRRPPSGESKQMEQAMRQLQQQIRQLHAAYLQQQRELETARRSGAASAGQPARDQARPSGAAQGAGQTAGPKPAAKPSVTLPPKPEPGLRQPVPRNFEAPRPQAREPVGLPPLLSPDEAGDIVDRMDGIDTEQARQGIWYAAQALRAPYLQDPEVWGFVQEYLPVLVSGTSPTLGSYEITSLIRPSRVGAEAAGILERHTYDLHSVLPRHVKIEVARVLANSSTPLEAWHAADNTLRRNNVSTSVEAALYLERALMAAQETQMQRYREARAKRYGG